jgi:hypothetical protein
VKKLHVAVALAVCLVIGLWLGWKAAAPPPGKGAAAPDPPMPETTNGAQHSRPPIFHPQPANLGAGIITDPKAAGYDPFRLAQAGVPEPQIFAAEPRDPVWAPAMEANLKRLIERDLAALAPGAKLGAVECHTLSCKLAVGGDDTSLKVAASALQIGSLARQMMFGKNARDGGAFEVTLIMDGEVRDPANWVRLVSQSRERHLAAIRASGTKTIYNLAAVPTEELAP